MFLCLEENLMGRCVACLPSLALSPANDSTQMLCQAVFALQQLPFLAHTALTTTQPS